MQQGKIGMCMYVYESGRNNKTGGIDLHGISHHGICRPFLIRIPDELDSVSRNKHITLKAPLTRAIDNSTALYQYLLHGSSDPLFC